MGGGQSTTCTQTIQNPDLLNVVTLSDSAVQRLPFIVDDNPLDKEQRSQNIDDFWRDRLDCLEQRFAESKRLTETEFRRLEVYIKKMSPGTGKLACPRIVEDVTMCILVYPNEPLKCNRNVKKLQLCLDTLMAEARRRQYLEDIRRARKKIC